MQNRIMEWFRWQRIFSRQSKLFGPEGPASSRMFEIRERIWRNLRSTPPPARCYSPCEPGWDQLTSELPIQSPSNVDGKSGEADP